MAEDIDDLLDEVETKFCTDSSSRRKENGGLPIKDQSAKGVQPKPKKLTSSGRGTKLDKDISEAIDDIFQDDDYDFQPPLISHSDALPKSGDAVKCFPVFIGGTKYMQGMATTVSQRVCDRLHCISCDNKVICFDEFSWNDSSSNYLFFRNNYPDFSRLKRNLQHSPGTRAYTCQCTWKSARSLKEINTDPSMKWVCTKH